MKNRDISLLRQAAEELHNNDKSYRRAINIDLLIYIVVLVVAVLSVRMFIGEPVRVKGDSMYPTLFDRERLIIEKITYYFKEPERGDIIICYYPGYIESCVKRVIGLPGDIIEVKDNVLYINGAPLDESEYWDDIMYQDVEPHLVSMGSVYVMGDNRNYSGDSRSPLIGDIPYNKIVGKAIFVMWPFDSLRVVEHINYSA